MICASELHIFDMNVVKTHKLFTAWAKLESSGPLSMIMILKTCETGITDLSGDSSV